MPYASCPTAVVDAPVEVVWALLVEPAGGGNVLDVRINSVDPPGPAAAGQKVAGETGPRFFHLKLTFQVIEIEAKRHRLVMDIQLPFGVAVYEDLRCTTLDAGQCRVDYHSGFEFPPRRRCALARVLMGRELDAGPVASLSRLKHAAELRFAGRENGSIS